MRLGQQESAIGHFESAVNVSEELVNAIPDDPKLQREFAMKRMHLGDCIVRSKRVEEALKLYEPAVATLRKLSESAPNSYSRDLSVALQFLGEAQEIQNKMLEAQKTFEEAVQLRKQVSASDSAAIHPRTIVRTDAFI